MSGYLVAEYASVGAGNLQHGIAPVLPVAPERETGPGQSSVVDFFSECHFVFSLLVNVNKSLRRG